jgi:hypothetical protein
MSPNSDTLSQQNYELPDNSLNRLSGGLICSPLFNCIFVVVIVARRCAEHPNRLPPISRLGRQNDTIDFSFGHTNLRWRTNVGPSIGC